MEMLTITGNRNQDLKTANQRKVVKSYFITNIELYGAIAEHLGISSEGLTVDELKAAINEKNVGIACVGIANRMVENESTVLDQMAAKLNKPVLRRDRKPLPKPIKRNAKPVVNHVKPGSVMAKALINKGLVIVK